MEKLTSLWFSGSYTAFLLLRTNRAQRKKKAVTKYKDWARFVQKIKKTIEEPENQSHKLGAQGWIIKQIRNISPPLNLFQI